MDRDCAGTCGGFYELYFIIILRLFPIHQALVIPVSAKIQAAGTGIVLFGKLSVPLQGKFFLFYSELQYLQAATFFST